MKMIFNRLFKKLNKLYTYSSILLLLLISCTEKAEQNIGEIPPTDSIQQIDPQNLLEEKPKDAMKTTDKEKVPEDSLESN